MPFVAMALACAMTTPESTVFEKLFHDDQPIGGGGTAIWFKAVTCALANEAMHKAAHITLSSTLRAPGLTMEFLWIDIRYECTPGDDYFVLFASFESPEASRRSAFQSSSDARLTAPFFFAKSRNSAEAFFIP